MEFVNMPKKKQLWFLYLFFVSVIAIVIISLIFMNQKVSDSKTSLRLGQTPFVDTTITLTGIKKGFFDKYNIDIKLTDTTWDAQFDLIASDTVDVAMAVLDEIVAKQRGLAEINKDVVYFLPAWQFLGLTFYSNKDILTLNEVRTKSPGKDSIKIFLAQFTDKTIAFPEGGIYEQAFSEFVRQAGMKLSDFKIVNTPLEVGLNGLQNSSVGMAAAAHQERPEAIRRGYKQAIEAQDLGKFILTGFMAQKKYDQQNQEALPRFTCGWYESVRYFDGHLEEAYEISKAYIESRGGKAPSFEEFKEARKFNIIPKNASETTQLFLQENSPAYWIHVWDDAVRNLRETGKGNAVPKDRSSFITPSILERTKGICS